MGKIEGGYRNEIEIRSAYQKMVVVWNELGDDA